MIGIGKNLFKANVKAGGGAVVYDADAQAYFTANTSITSAADKNAINTFYLGLKSDGIYTKIKAMYLPIWGSAASCKWNLVNPLDTNAAFRLTFSTGWTFSSGGALPNGTSAYADTFYTPSVNGILNSSHISYYSRVNSASNGQTISANNSLGSAGGTSMYLKSISAGSFYGNVDIYPSVLSDYASTTNSDSRGFYITSRTASNSQKGYKNGSVIGSSTSSGNRTNRSLYLAATNKDNPVQITEYGIYECAFASIGDGLTDTQVTNFYNRIQTLMTYFGINV